MICAARTGTFIGITSGIARNMVCRMIGISKRLCRASPLAYIVNIVVVLLSLSVQVPVVAVSSQAQSHSDTTAPAIPDFLSPFGDYPNTLQLTDSHRKTFHPVLLVPKGIYPKPLDYRKARGLASPQSVWKSKKCRPCRWLTELIQRCQKRHWALGRYDENRLEMYTSQLFQNLDNHIDGYSGQRTVHLGIDLGAPVGTKVYAFTDGIVHSVGYNAEHGDYGYVIVIQHALPSGMDVWALYGHLDRSTIKGKSHGSRIRKGQVLGRIGACHENGGWEAPHVHFQLAIHPPETHDMPGASSVDDRSKALLHYPDPRYVLGPLY